MATSQTTNLHLVKPDYTETGDVDVINDNMDIIDGAVGAINTSLGGKKSTQTAKADPTASGTSLTFIDTVTQNANGEITATKKTVKDMEGGSTSAAGAHGLVPAPPQATNWSRFLRSDGTWKAFLKSSATLPYTIAANGTLSKTSGELFQASAFSDRNPIAITGLDTGNASVNLVSFNMVVSSSTPMIVLHNPTGAAVSGTLSLTVLTIEK